MTGDCVAGHPPPDVQVQVLLQIVEVGLGKCVCPDEISGFAIDDFDGEWIELVVSVLPVQGFLSPTGKGEALPTSQTDRYTTAGMQKRRRCCIAFGDTGNNLRFAVGLTGLFVSGVCFCGSQELPTGSRSQLRGMLWATLMVTAQSPRSSSMSLRKSCRASKRLIDPDCGSCGADERGLRVYRLRGRDSSRIRPLQISKPPMVPNFISRMSFSSPAIALSFLLFIKRELFALFRLCSPLVRTIRAIKSTALQNKACSEVLFRPLARYSSTAIVAIVRLTLKTSATSLIVP